ncbi:MAG: Ig-like domain-containing protein, partial [Parabacteroides sp.]|nr:Ig-like domain-containing protein [Parabacteroides sp.]
MRYFQYFGVVILTMLAGCNNYDSFVVTEKPYVNQKSVQLYFGEHAGDRSTIQLVSSPVGKNYTWTSQDPTVATVDQNGLVKAVGEGITSIVVSSKDDQTIIDVNVKKYIPLVGFTLSTHSVIGF